MPHIHVGPLLHVALRAAERGWKIFPLAPASKRPAVRAWEPRATADPDRIRRCWSTGSFNVGVATGPSRLVVVDLDVPKDASDVPPDSAPSGIVDGRDALAHLAEELDEEFPLATLTARTASGGWHMYFRAPSGMRLRNTAGRLGWKIDTRAAGGYVVGPGSIVRGATYAVTLDVAPAPLPTWLARLLDDSPPPQTPATVALRAPTGHGPYLDAALAAELGRVTRNHTPGNRNNALYQAAVALGQLVAGGELGADTVTAHLGRAASTVGLDELEARRTIVSGLRAGARRPRTVQGGRQAA